MNRARLTADGSPTLLNLQTGEHYHSIHGARTESLHVFIQSGLHKVAEKQNTIRILEIGFGTGLNFLLSLQECQKHGWQLQYHALEPFPVSSEEFELFLKEFPDLDKEKIQLLKEKYPNDLIHENKGFYLNLIQQPLLLAPDLPKVDLIYYDAFSPTTQAEMWEKEAFEKMSEAAIDGTIFVTYCIRSYIRRNLESLGWKTEKLPGPPRKREMLRAVFQG